MAEGEIRVRLTAQADLAQTQKAGQRVGEAVKQGMHTSLSSTEMASQVGKSIATAAKWARIEAEKAARMASAESVKPAAGLQSFINQQFGPGRGQLVGPSGPEFWKQAVPPIIKPTPQAAGLGGLLGQLTNARSGPLSSPLAIAAQVGAALAGLRVAVGYVRFAFRSLVAPMRQFYQFLKQSAELARQNYTKALTAGGLPLGFSTHRAMMAQVIGVGEKDVLQYASAIVYLSKRMESATKQIASDTIALTELSYSARALQVSFQAIQSAVTSQFAPALRNMLDAIREFVDGARPYIAQFVAYQKGVIAGLLGATGNTALGALLAGAKAGELGAPSAFSRRPPISSWERMGVVVGIGGGTDYTKQTAANTRGILEILRNRNRLDMSTDYAELKLQPRP